ncbi:MAG: D-alanyl-D-alanine carboxypeptidase [Bacteroidales bacterium]|nr:D-alanyl-D-alanine carboxypeptidase [Bacteroidales bacterium]
MNKKGATLRIRIGMALLGILIATAPAAAQRKPQFPAQTGIYIEDLTTGEVVYDLNADQPRTPASITKALTSASVLSTQGAWTEFVTEVYAIGSIEGGRLQGDLLVKTVGDPTLESEYFPDYQGFADSIAASLKAHGIESIRGRVIIDQEALPYEEAPEGWVDEDLVWPYGTLHQSASFRDNKVILSMPSKRTRPNVPGLEVRHTPGKGGLTVDRKRGSQAVVTRGTPRQKGESIEIANPLPGEMMRSEIERKIKVDNQAGASQGADTLLVYGHESPAFLDILQSLMFRSDNLMAEGMLRTLAPGGTRSDAVEAERQLWGLRDLDVSLLTLEDGSGLSRNDRFTPYFLADVLVWMASSIYSADYVGLFPRVGEEGTVKNLLKGTRLEGRLALKSGSMKSVQSYAGYAIDDRGHPTHAIVIMVNGFTNRGAVKSAIEQLLLDKIEIPETSPLSL